MEKTLLQLIAEMKSDLDSVEKFLNEGTLDCVGSAYHYLADMRETLDQAIYKIADLHYKKTSEARERRV